MRQVRLGGEVQVRVVEERRQQAEDSDLQLRLVRIPFQPLSDEGDQVWNKGRQLGVGSNIFENCRAKEFTVTQDAANQGSVVLDQCWA